MAYWECWPIEVEAGPPNIPPRGVLANCACPRKLGLSKRFLYKYVAQSASLSFPFSLNRLSQGFSLGDSSKIASAGRRSTSEGDFGDSVLQLDRTDRT
jgi:hypothetical protein